MFALEDERESEEESEEDGRGRGWWVGSEVAAVLW